MVNQEYSYSSSKDTISTLRSKSSKVFLQSNKISKPKSKIGDFSLELPESFIEVKAKEIKYALKKGGELDMAHLKNVIRKYLIQKYEEIAETNRAFKKKTEAIIEEGISHFSFYLDNTKTDYITKTGLFDDPIFNNIDFSAIFPGSQKTQTHSLIQMIMSKGKLKKMSQKKGVKKNPDQDDPGKDMIREFDLTRYRKKA